jgi:hypothetical protein
VTPGAQLRRASRSPCISPMCSSAERRSPAISSAITSGSGRESASSRLSSFSHKRSSEHLSRATHHHRGPPGDREQALHVLDGVELLVRAVGPKVVPLAHHALAVGVALAGEGYDRGLLAEGRVGEDDLVAV